MAYNPAMYQQYGNMYGNSYAQQMPMQTLPQVMPQAQSYGNQMTVKGEIEWVDGEAAAKSYQIPAGMTKPVALWDTNDTVIYLKSMNPMGMPNPLQKIHYKMEEMVPKYMGQSGTQNLMSGEAETQKNVPDMSEYVKKDDIERIKHELMEAINSANTSNASGTVRKTGKSEV